MASFLPGELVAPVAAGAELRCDVRDSALFHGMTDTEVDAVLDRLQPRVFGPGQVIFRCGQPGADLYLLTEGRVKLTVTSRDGRENLFRIAGPGEMFGVTAAFDPGSRSSTATALTPAMTMVMERTVMLWWMAAQPTIAEQLLRMLSRQARDLSAAVTDLVCCDVATRVAKRLLDLAGAYGYAQDGATRVDHRLTQSEIAQLVGASRETVCKALNVFANSGWIEIDDRSLVITDGQRLSTLASGLLAVE